MKVIALIAMAALAVTAYAEAEPKNKAQQISNILNHNVHVLANKIKARKKYKSRHFYDKLPNAPGGLMNFCGPPGSFCHVNKRSAEPVNPEDTSDDVDDIDEKLLADVVEVLEDNLGVGFKFEA